MPTCSPGVWSKDGAFMKGLSSFLLSSVHAFTACAASAAPPAARDIATADITANLTRIRASEIGRALSESRTRRAGHAAAQTERSAATEIERESRADGRERLVVEPASRSEGQSVTGCS